MISCPFVISKESKSRLDRKSVESFAETEKSNLRRKVSCSEGRLRLSEPRAFLLPRAFLSINRAAGSVMGQFKRLLQRYYDGEKGLIPLDRCAEPKEATIMATSSPISSIGVPADLRILTACATRYGCRQAANGVFNDRRAACLLRCQVSPRAPGRCWRSWR
jgi:hypothetical protein